MVDNTKAITPTAPGNGAKRQTRRIYIRKSDIVLEAAERVFLREGFAATSMDQVAEEAGVSKRTVYSNFSSKELLFAAVISQRCAAVVPDSRKVALAMTQPLEQGLQTLAVAFLKGVLDPAQIEFYQTVIAAVRRRPEIGKIMYEGPIARSQQTFAEYLGAQAAAGTLALDDANIAAAQLIALLKTNVHMKLLFGRPARIGPAFLTRSVQASIKLFLYGVLPR